MIEVVVCLEGVDFGEILELICGREKLRNPRIWRRRALETFLLLRDAETNI